MESSIATADKARARSRSAGLAVLVAGVAVIIGALGSAAADWLWVAILVGILGMVIGIPGVRDQQAPADGEPGRWGSLMIRYGGAVLVLLGLILLVWDAIGDPPEEAGSVFVDVLWMVALVTFVLGVILFAIGILKAKVLPAAAAILMLVGLVGGIALDMATGAFFSDEGTQWGFLIGFSLFGLGMAWVGYTVFSGRTRGPRSEVPAKG